MGGAVMPYTSPSVATITDAVLNVDFGFEAQTVGRMRGRIDEDLDMMRGFPLYGDNHIVYPRNELVERIEQQDINKAWNSFYIVEGHDQNGDVSCVYNMLAAIIEGSWNRSFGIENYLTLSPMSGYRWNGTRNSGSNIFGSANWGEGTGLLPLRSERNLSLAQRGLFKHTHPHNGYGTTFQNGWKETAKSFRLQEWYRIRSVEEWYSAAINGFGLGGGRSGHAIYHCLLSIDNGNLYSGYLNSWGQWGATLEIARGQMLKSFGWDSESRIRSMINHGAYAGRTIRRPSWLPMQQ